MYSQPARNISKVLFFLGVLLALSNNAYALGPYTKDLEKNGQLKISEDSCNDIENKVGQLLYVNIDGNGTDDPKTISPEYLKLVSDLQIGAIIPHFGASTTGVSFEKRSAQLAAFQRVSKVPLLIGADNFDYMLPATHGRVVHLGMGFGGGLLMNMGGEITEGCLENLSYVDGFLEKAMGVNLALGPTVDKSERWGFANSDADTVYPYANAILTSLKKNGILNTLKHFPYTPDDFSLHKQTKDEKLSLEQVQEKIKIFKLLAPQTDLIMTTHIYNSEIDSKDVVTFSKKWISILRGSLNFEGLIVTDGLFMFDRYSENIKNMSAKWENKDVTDNTSIFAARAIIAGHDLIFLEGSATQTRKVFKNLHYLACQDTKMSSLLRERIKESYERIVSFKQKHHDAFVQPPPPNPELTKGAALAFASTGEKWDLAKFEDKSTWHLPLAYACGVNGDFRDIRNNIERIH